MTSFVTKELFRIDSLEFLERVESDKYQLIYSDIRSLKEDELEEYLQYFSKIVQQARRILTSSGSITIHTTQQFSHIIRYMLDQMYGRENFRNEIILPKKPLLNRDMYDFRLEVLLNYSKSNEFSSYPITRAIRSYEKKQLDNKFNYEDAKGSYYFRNLTIRSRRENRPNLFFQWKGLTPPDNHIWMFSMESLNNLFEQGLIYIPERGKPKLKVYLTDNNKRISVGTIWDDLYPSDPQELFGRLIAMFSKERDFVLDPFCMHGNFIIAAERQERNWIGCISDEKNNGTIIRKLSGDADMQLDRDYRILDMQDVKLRNIPQISDYRNYPIGLEFERTIETRMRAVSIGEDTLLTCLKYKLWGSKNGNLKNWNVNDYILFIVGKQVAALAQIKGEMIKSDQIIWKHGLYPYRVPIEFIFMLTLENRISIQGEVRTALKGNWDNYGIPLLNRLLLPVQSADYFMELLRECQNSMQEYDENINYYLTLVSHDNDEMQLDKEKDSLPENAIIKNPFRFSGLKIDHWRQFELVEITFHERLTIITGANGTGKTTILNIVNTHFGWETPIVSVPKRGVRRDNSFYSENRDTLGDVPQQKVKIGTMHYSDGSENDIIIPNVVSDTYQVTLEKDIRLNGLYIPSHRTIFSYDKVDSILSEIRPINDIFNDYSEAVKNDFLAVQSARKPIRILKESLISLAMFGYGNEVIHQNIIGLELFKQYERVLSIVLPENLGFEGISIQIPDVIVNTKTGDFSLDAVSGGIAAIIDISWQIFLAYNVNGSFVMTLDEPENHLHPEMQRALMPNLIAAFPHVQFIVVTHNPFIVSSVPESKVYVLDYNHQRKVISNSLDFVNKSGTANDILRDALGLSVTMPVWAERRLDEITQKYQNQRLSHEMMQSLRRDLESIGLERYVADAVVRFDEGDSHD